MSLQCEGERAAPPAAVRAGLAARLLLLAEFLLIYAGGPLLVLAMRERGVLVVLLWGGALFAHLMGGRGVGLSRPDRSAIGNAVLRFALFAPLIALATWLAMPASFLDLPRHRPEFWVLLMVLYPLLSVWPQEILYRRFLFHRYRPLFGPELGLIAASAIAFGFAHVIMLNWVAIAMTAAGGAIFARDYARTRSLALSCLDHALYGCLVFTVGLGRFFFTGAAWHH